MRTIFGPVPSRRLGRSLGIDVIPPKTCSYNCVYCESGLTTHWTIARERFVDPDLVLDELTDYFRCYPQGADAITFSSAGEPTLYKPLGDLLRAIKNRFPSLPLIVLTNGSLLWDSEVRSDLTAADRVVPSLDAVIADVFTKVNVPHPRLDLDTIIEGLKAFGKDYHGQFHLEVLLVAGYNDHPEHLRELRRVIDQLNPDQIELNTVVRPPADPNVRGLSEQELHSLLPFFPANTQIVGHYCGSTPLKYDADLAVRVMEVVRRRPCTKSEMAAALSVESEELQRAL
ncbi:MAG: radical SAM protein, partial [Desulforhabdus sp.]|nr:radical SAM protein [Desulforhabdus sp.]